MLHRFLSPQQRYQRRMARIERWDRPLKTPFDRLRAWTHMIFSDHGIFRLIYLNAHQVTPDFWRSAQPAPYQIKRFQKMGIRTIVNLRGGREQGAWPLEKETCEKAGITLIDFVVRSREAPSRETILQAKELFETLQYPVLVHCKSGADRAGLMAALYLVLHEGRPVEDASKQLSWRFGHFKFAKTGILDAFFALYQKEGKGMSFLEWVEQVYDQERLIKTFKPSFWSDIIVDRLIRRE